jgi:tyrosinase
MATYTRNNAWNSDGDFTNTDLLWYAKGVRQMMGRTLDNQASWWFFAAIHGEYVNPKTRPKAFPSWAVLKSPPTVPTTPLPTRAIQELFWNQCQHGTWYFLPWHRGYLLALEAQLREDIVSLGGPSGWALPYWNYFGGNNGNQYKMPPAFSAKKLPDGTQNPLYVSMRYGPDNNGKIYIPTPTGSAAHPADANLSDGTVLESCLANDLFTGSDSITKSPGFGGLATGFHHIGRTFGSIESDPHNLVHVYIGGAISNKDAGLMSDPGIAALDPIFYLHHANIDRIWAVWNIGGNSNPSDPKWLNGPTRQFVMPWSQGQSWHYTPMQMDNLNELNYTYEELAAPASTGSAPALALRLDLLGATAAANKVKKGLAIQRLPKHTELLGANTGAVPVRGPITNASVRIEPKVLRKVEESLVNASEKSLPDRVYLKLENIRGTSDAAVLGVYVNLPADAKPGVRGRFFAGSVALFGLRRASMDDGQHAGDGLTFLLDITPTIDRMFVSKLLDVASLRIDIIPTRKLPDGVDIKIGRMRVYRETY